MTNAHINSETSVGSFTSQRGLDRATPLEVLTIRSHELTALYGVVKTIAHSERMMERALMLGHTMVHQPLDMLAAAIGILRAFEVNTEHFALLHRIARRRVTDSRWLSEAVNECKRLVDAVARRLDVGPVYRIGPPSPRLMREAKRRSGRMIEVSSGQAL